MKKHVVWVVEVFVKGEWQATGDMLLTRATGRAHANYLNDEDDYNSYRIAPYARTEGKS